MIMVAVVVLVLILGVGGYMVFRPHPKGGEMGVNPTVVTPNAQQQEKDLFQQAKDADSAKKWDDAIALYNKVADLNGPMKGQAVDAINLDTKLKQGTDPSQVEKQTFQQASTALQKKQYAQAKSLFQQVVDLKVPDSTLAPEAQTQLANIEPIIRDKAEFDAAAGAQTRGDLQGALNQFTAIAGKPGNYQAEAKARIPKLNLMINNAGAQQEFNAALQLEQSDPKGALAKFQAIAGGSGPFKTDAQTHIQQINEKFAGAEAQQQFDAALKAQSSGDLQGALKQFQALAAKPGPKHDDAQRLAQQITDQIAQQQAQQQMNAADQAKASGDLKGALALYKAIAAKPGPNQAVAQVKVELVAQLLADANKPAPAPAPAPTPAPGPAPAPTPTAGGARAGVVTLIPGGDYEAWNGPVQKGQILPDTAIQGGLKPIGALTVPPIDAPPKAYVIFIINIGPDGSVTPGRKTSDDNALGPQVMPAAKGWKFNPPTVKGKPVATAIQVKVAF
jgi:hypothetical protein